MAATLYIYQKFRVTVDGADVEGGSVAAPEQITVDGYVKDVSKNVSGTPSATTWDVWESGAEEAVTDFDFLYISSTQNVYLELTADKGGENGTVVFAIEIQANVPQLLNSDDCYANYSADFAGSPAVDVIDRLRVRNASGSDAVVRVVLVT